MTQLLLLLLLSRREKIIKAGWKDFFKYFRLVKISAISVFVIFCNIFIADSSQEKGTALYSIRRMNLVCFNSLVCFNIAEI